MPRKAKPAYVFAKANGSFKFEGRRFKLVPGQVWAADCPLVNAYPESFTDEPPHLHGVDWGDDAPIEQATNAPGEKRTTTRVKAD